MIETGTATTASTTTLGRRGEPCSYLCAGGQYRCEKGTRSPRPPSEIRKPSPEPSACAVPATSRPTPAFLHFRLARRARLGREEGPGVRCRGRHRRRPDHRPGPTGNHESDRGTAWRYYLLDQTRKPVPTKRFPHAGSTPATTGSVEHRRNRNVGRTPRPGHLLPPRTACPPTTATSRHLNRQDLGQGQRPVAIRRQPSPPRRPLTAKLPR